MTKPLLGGGAIAVALLSVSLTSDLQPSVAEPLALTSPEQPQTQQKGNAPVLNISYQVASTSGIPAHAGPVEVTSEGEKETVKGVTLTTEGKATVAEAEPPDPPLSFVATAYSLRGRTASGRLVSKGLIAADRRILPLGTRVRLEAGSYSGEYLVADTGGAVRGRRIDIWLPSTREAMRFGRRPVKLTVLTRVRPRVTGRSRAR